MDPRSKLQPRRRAGVLNVTVWAAMAMSTGLAESASFQPQRREDQDQAQRWKQAQDSEQAQVSASARDADRPAVFGDRQFPLHVHVRVHWTAVLLGPLAHGRR